MLNWLKTKIFSKKPPPENLDLKRLEERCLKLQDSISTIQSTIGVVAKITSSQVSKQVKNEQIDSGILEVLTQHEQELDSFKDLLNQHADVINTLRKHVYKDILKEDKKKDLDESSEINNFLDIKKKINKDN